MNLYFLFSVVFVVICNDVIHTEALLARFSGDGMQIDDVVEARGTITWKKRPILFKLFRNGVMLLKVEIRGIRRKLHVWDARRQVADECDIAKCNVGPGLEYNLRVWLAPGRIVIYYNKKSVGAYPCSPGKITAAYLGGAYNRGVIKIDRWNKITCVEDDVCGMTSDRKAVTEQQCPVEYRQQRIIGGSNADAGSTPWQVAIRRKRMPVTEYPHECGGVLLHSCWALSAAHCLRLSSDARTHFVRVGDYYNKDGGKNKYFRRYEDSQDLDIERFINHEGYWNLPSPRNDISLIQLRKVNGDQCARFGVFVQPVCLPSSALQFRYETDCSISGWGATKEKQSIADYPACLQTTRVTLKDKAFCKTHYPDDEEGPMILDSMVCAHGIGEDGQVVDACQGDSGGPLVCSPTINDQNAKSTGPHTIWGITSWGEGCGNKPGVYTKVFNFVGWIGEVLMKHCDYVPE